MGGGMGSTFRLFRKVGRKGASSIEVDQRGGSSMARNGRENISQILEKRRVKGWGALRPLLMRRRVRGFRLEGGVGVKEGTSVILFI